MKWLEPLSISFRASWPKFQHTYFCSWHLLLRRTFTPVSFFFPFAFHFCSSKKAIQFWKFEADCLQPPFFLLCRGLELYRVECEILLVRCSSNAAVLDRLQSTTKTMFDAVFILSFLLLLFFWSSHGWSAIFFFLFSVPIFLSFPSSV